eukprot:118434_1
MPSTRSKTKKESEAEGPKKQPYIRMAFDAIVHTKHGGKGVSRQKIANYIKTNFEVTPGSHFNTALRKALGDGIERGVLTPGATPQRYKITPLGRKENGEKNKSKKFDAEIEEKKARKAKRAAKKKQEAEKKRKTKAAAKKKKRKSGS